MTRASAPKLAQLLVRLQEARGLKLAGVLGLLAALLLACALLVYATGGTRTAYLHGIYIPVILGGFLLFRIGGAATGIAAGILIGPWMPLDVAAGTPQPTISWVYRLTFFLLIGLFTGQLAHTLREHANQLSHTYAQTLLSFASLVSLRDEQTAGHCERVAQNARAIGQALQLPRQALQELYWAGLLHDLGKVAIPDSILLKPGTLAPTEYEIVKTHSSIGADLLLNASPDFAAVATGVRAHHERWDGNGYPDSLKGNEIPLFGRILAVCDVFEAITSIRPYHDAMPAEQAIKLIEDGSGDQFDPAIVKEFTQLYRQGTIQVASPGQRPILLERLRDFRPQNDSQTRLPIQPS